ncbi:MAG: hypothetical protein B6I36_07105 [Desulfobacteraceae bacterium 4572_35.1]|nr:MAG: hypothetical protein B6I36_07105 [Desulfobacteraceae bacterium 4572_35.1]
MKLLIPAFIIFVLGFLGLSIGIICGRKGITGGCSSSEGKLADLKCTCGREDKGGNLACDNVAIEVVCPEENPEQYRELLEHLDKTQSQG